MNSAMTSLLHAGFGSGHPNRPILVLVALGLILSEYLFHRVNHVESHDAGETAVSLAIAVGNKARMPFLADDDVVVHGNPERLCPSQSGSP
jgi:hypothetical protein